MREALTLSRDGVTAWATQRIRSARFRGNGGRLSVAIGIWLAVLSKLARYTVMAQDSGEWKGLMAGSHGKGSGSGAIGRRRIVPNALLPCQSVHNQGSKGKATS